MSRSLKPIVMRQSILGDWPVISGWFSNAEELLLWAGTELRFPFDEDQFKGMLKQAEGQHPVRRCFSFDLEGHLVGQAQVVLDHRNEVGRLARIAVAPEQRGKGIGESMVRVLVRSLFADGLTRLELNVYPQNRRARHLYEKLGFLEEGVRRQAVAFGNSRYDVIIMGMLPSEFIDERRA